MGNLEAHWSRLRSSVQKDLTSFTTGVWPGTMWLEAAVVEAQLARSELFCRSCLSSLINSHFESCISRLLPRVVHSQATGNNVNPQGPRSDQRALSALSLTVRVIGIWYSLGPMCFKLLPQHQVALRAKWRAVDPY